MPLYFPPVPVELYLLLVVLSLPLGIIIWTDPASVKRRLLVGVLVAVALAVPTLLLAAVVGDPCSADMSLWMRIVSGCWY